MEVEGQMNPHPQQLHTAVYGQVISNRCLGQIAGDTLVSETAADRKKPK